MRIWLFVCVFMPYLLAAQATTPEMERVWKQMRKQYTYERSDDYHGPEKESNQTAPIESAPQQLGENAGQTYNGIPFEEGVPASGDDTQQASGEGGYGQEGQSGEQASGSAKLTVNPGKPYNFEAWDASLSVVFIVLLCVAASVLIFWFLRNRQKSNDRMKQVSLADDPSAVSIDTLKAQLEAALSKEDYKGAVRIYLLFALKNLMEKQLLFWKRDKTNYQYTVELKGQPVATYFKNIVRIYDQIWYGAQSIDKARFLILQQHLEHNYQRLIREQ